MRCASKARVGSVEENECRTIVFEHRVHVLISGVWADGGVGVVAAPVTPCGGGWKCGNYLIY